MRYTKVNLEKFDKLHAAGYLRKQTLDNLTIWNYTHKTQYERAWDETTTLARGLITRDNGIIHARSFPKFYNLGEAPGPGLDTLPNESPIITKKMDGYLGLTYWNKKVGRVDIASRGSFTSEYALWATKWLHENNRCSLEVPEEETYTYVFEILYPHRRIVVDNSKNPGLVLLAAINIRTGEELDRQQLEFFGRLYRWPVVEAFPTTTIEDCLRLKAEIRAAELEGFVAFYPKSGIRVKIKGDEYSKIHWKMVHTTSKLIWEILSGVNETLTIDDLMEGLPLQYQNWIVITGAQVMKQHAILVERAIVAAHNVWPKSFKPIAAERKYIVEQLQEKYSDIWHEALFMIDGHKLRATESLWRRIQPKHAIPILRDGDDE